MKLIRRIIFIILILILPFITLIRGAVFLHNTYALHPWLSVLLASGGTLLLLTLYFSFIAKKIKGRRSSRKEIKRRALFAGILIFLFCLKALIFLSIDNVKHHEVQQEFLSLHPILRLSVSTLIFIDKDMIITDASRLPEDYRKMGLASKKNSLHYIQEDGFVHAIDIRTNTRSEIRNKLIKWYFSAMGFNTLRHGGTADHLHVSLKSHHRPWAK